LTDKQLDSLLECHQNLGVPNPSIVECAKALEKSGEGKSPDDDPYIDQLFQVGQHLMSCRGFLNTLPAVDERCSVLPLLELIFVPPIGLLLVGSALGWALRGFKA